MHFRDKLRAADRWSLGQKHAAQKVSCLRNPPRAFLDRSGIPDYLHGLCKTVWGRAWSGRACCRRLHLRQGTRQVACHCVVLHRDNETLPLRMRPLHLHDEAGCSLEIPNPHSVPCPSTPCVNHAII